jgi:hypothetical protein
MAKRALCVGINDYPGVGSDLRGCVNDANAWADLLRQNFGFPDANVTLLLDGQATKAAILDNLSAMIKGATAGDHLVFTNSSHGTYVADADGDESGEEFYDEALCPYDCAENLIVDDELRELFAQLPKGVKLTVISDSCHSASVTRAPSETLTDELRPRYLEPEAIGRKGIRYDKKKIAKPKKDGKYPQADMKELLLSGCRSTEYSYDAKIDGTFHGAMTYYALKIIKDYDYDITWSKLHELLEPQLLPKYPQHPSLEGSDGSKSQRIFE